MLYYLVKYTGTNLFDTLLGIQMGVPSPTVVMVISAPGSVLDGQHQPSLQDTHHTVALVLGAVELAPHGQAVVRLNVAPVSQKK